MDGPTIAALVTSSLAAITTAWQLVLRARTNETDATKAAGERYEGATDAAVDALQAALGHLQGEVNVLRDRVSGFERALAKCEADKAQLAAEVARLAS